MNKLLVSFKHVYCKINDFILALCETVKITQWAECEWTLVRYNMLY